ncbi:MAG: cyclic nucleotide-binding domain-containing protein [Rhodobacter sp.]|nr:cyclic nucleotide-binding domain-containing protein [Rhodobacter sp.]
MELHSIKDLLADHPVFKDFDEETLDLLAGCGRNEHFAKGSLIYKEGDEADKVYIIRRGDVAIEIAAPGRPAIVVETLNQGDVAGWSWLVPPYRSSADARAVTEVSAVSLDANCVRGKCDDHPALGYQIFKTWLPHLTKRVRAQRLQLLDLYGAG